MQTPKLNEVKQQAGFSLEDINIEGFAPMPSPAEIKKMAPLTEAAAENVNKSRNQIKQILTGEDNRLMVITGPCSIHDPKAALDYAQRLAELSEHISETIFPVMRVYFEKPRTVVGWKGYINDPDMNNSFNMAKGMLKARELMIKINEMGLAVATDWTRSVRSTWANSSAGMPSVRAQPKVKPTEKWRAVCPLRSVLRTAPTAFWTARLTPSKPAAKATTS